MSDFIVCVRNIQNGAFGNEPGVTYFLKVPPSAATISVDHRVARRSEWFDAVLEGSVTGGDEDGNTCGDILVFIHGYNNDQKAVLERHRQLKQSLREGGFNGEVISFDWPSADKTLNYLEDRSDAKKTAIKLVDDCIKPCALMQDTDCRISIHLLAHSSGAFVVREAFDDADDRPGVAASNWTTSQIMFIGADVSARSLSADNPKSASLYRHCVRLTNYSNPYDSALKLSSVKRLGAAPRAGRVGLPAGIPENAVNVNCGVYYDENKSKIETLRNKNHSWYIGDPWFTRDMFFTMQGDIDRYSIPTRVYKEGELFLKKGDR